MKKITQLKIVHWMIYIINVILITFLSISIYKTSYQICEDFQARSFLEKAKYLPQIPSRMLFSTVCLMVCIGISNIILHYIHRNKMWISLLILSINIIQCIYITYYLNYSYKGLFLFLTASIFLYIQWIPGKVFLLTVTLISFILLDYDLISVKINLISFQNYVNYYSEQQRMYLYGMKTVLISLNDISFFFFLFLLLQSKIKENKQYVWLNNKLKEKAKELEIANGKLENYAFIPAIEKLIEEINTFSNTKVKLIIEGKVLKLNDDEEQTIYRVVQESLTNAMRHGKAMNIEVKIIFGYYELSIIIQDNGIGCSHISKGFGLTHIEERIEMLGGTVEFSSQADEGFTTGLTIPIRWGSAYD